MTNKKLAIPEYMESKEVRAIRKQLAMTQAEFADMLGVSKPTVERWEKSKDPVKGPVVMALYLLVRDENTIENLSIPDRSTNLRLYYMYKNDICTVIDVDEINQKIHIKNYTRNLLYKAFGVNNQPNYEDYIEFLESRCFPESRDKKKIILKELNLPFYDPFLIIEKTEGRMGEDDFWIKIER